MKYEVEISSAYAQWWRYNLYVMVVGFDREGNRVGYDSLTDRVYDVSDSGMRTPPAGYDARRPVRLQSVDCDYVEVYLYVVTNTFPDSDVIRDSRSFPAVLTVRAGGRVVEEKEYPVNQWGGLTVVAHRVGASGK